MLEGRQTTGEPMKVVAYVRVSTEEQESSGLGLEAQESRVRAYCGLYGHELVDLVQDAASGKNLRRDGLQKALAMLRTGEAEGLIVAKLDRLTRSVRDMGELLEGYFSGRSSLLAVAEQIDTSTAAGRMVINLLTSVAQWERETIGERTRDALQAKKDRGERAGTIPYGFRLAGDGARLEADPAEQAVIAEARRLRHGGRSLRAVAAEMERSGLRNRRGKAFAAPHVLKMLAA